MKNTPTPLGKKTYAEYEKELKEFNLSSQRVELGEIDDLKRFISNAQQKLKTATNYHKSAEKTDTKYVKVLDAWAKLDNQKNQLVKELRAEVKAGKSINKEVKADLTKARKSAKVIEKQLKDLGLDGSAVNKENTQIEKLADSLNKLNYAFLDELPF
jgi:superfamily II DNA helicase RecQ